MDENIRNLIQVLLTNPDPDVRRAAAEELGKYEDRNILGVLSIALKDENKGVIDAVARALINIGGVDAARAIVHHIEDENIATRNLAAKLLVNLGTSSIHAIIPYLQDSNKDTRKMAVDILGEIRSKESIYYLLPLLHDPDPNVITSTLEAFGNIGSNKVIESICETFEKYPFAKLMAIEALGKIGGNNARQFLEEKYKKALENNIKEEVYLFALLDALGNVGNETTLKLLIENYDKTPETLHDVLLHEIIQIVEKNNIDFCFEEKFKKDLLKALHNDNINIKLSAAKGLIQFEDELITRELLFSLGISEDIDCLIIANMPTRRNVFHIAVECLKTTTRQSSIFQIILLLGKLASEFSRSIEKLHTQKIDNESLSKAFDAITSHWYDINQENWDIAVEALFRIDSDRAAQFLISIMNEIDPWPRSVLIGQLANIPVAQATYCINCFINDENDLVREAALMALKTANSNVKTKDSDN